MPVRRRGVANTQVYAEDLHPPQGRGGRPNAGWEVHAGAGHLRQGDRRNDRVEVERLISGGPGHLLPQVDPRNPGRGAHPAADPRRKGGDKSADAAGTGIEEGRVVPHPRPCLAAGACEQIRDRRHGDRPGGPAVPHPAKGGAPHLPVVGEEELPAHRSPESPEKPLLEIPRFDRAAHGLPDPLGGEIGEAPPDDVRRMPVQVGLKRERGDLPPEENPGVARDRLPRNTRKIEDPLPHARIGKVKEVAAPVEHVPAGPDRTAPSAGLGLRLEDQEILTRGRQRSRRRQPGDPSSEDENHPCPSYSPMSIVLSHMATTRNRSPMDP